MVAVGRLHVPILEPLLQLPFFADLVRREAGARGDELFAQIRVHAQNLRRPDAVAEQVADDLLVHCRPGADAAAGWNAVFSGDADGQVTSQWCCGSSTSESRKNCAAPFIAG